MQCRHCGMDSRSTDNCEWCRKSMHSGPVAPQPSPVPPGAASGPNAYSPPVPLTQPPYNPYPQAPGTPQATVSMPPTLQPTQAMPPVTASGGQQTTAIDPMAHPALHQTIAMTPGAQPTVQMNPALHRRVSLTGEVIEGPAPTPRTMSAPILSNGLPAAAFTPEAVQAAIRANDFSQGERWEQALAIAMPIIAVSLYLIHLAPTIMPWITFANIFLTPMILGGTRAIPPFDDDFMDAGVVLTVCLLMGPVTALVVYLIMGAIKQEVNSSLVAVLAVSIFLPLLFLIPWLTSDGASGSAKLMVAFIWGLLSFFRVMAAFAGWMCSSFFRPLNE